MIHIKNGKVENEYVRAGGKKWQLRNPDEPYIEVVDEFGYKDYKLNCRMRKKYVQSCHFTENASCLHEIRVQKEKLKYQLETYGEVDRLDKMYYQSLCKRYGYSCAEFDKLIA
jgi:asparagine synthetase A